MKRRRVLILEDEFLVVGEVIEALTNNRAQRLLDSHLARKLDRRGVNRQPLFRLDERVAALRLAAVLDTQRCDLAQREGKVIERARVAALELELEFADRHGDPRGRAYLTLVEGNLDSRRATILRVFEAPIEIRSEEHTSELQSRSDLV